MLIAVSQRVVVDPTTGERRDALDQRWPRLLNAAGLVSGAVPNDPEILGPWLARLAPGGVLLTGGNDLARYGGDAPERDQVERLLVQHARARGLPVLGVCRGMQMLIDLFAGTLEPVAGHVGCTHEIAVEGGRRQVNSYHRWAARMAPPELEPWAIADDGVIEAVRHREEAIVGHMWHPERVDPPGSWDLARLQEVFACAR